MLSRISVEARRPSVSFIAAPAASWVDDYLAWVSPDLPYCCRRDITDDYCPPPDQCGAEPGLRSALPPTIPQPGQLPAVAGHEGSCFDCGPCFHPGKAAQDDAWEMPPDGRPDVAQVQATLPWFLTARPSQACAKGGAGVYSGALALEGRDGGDGGEKGKEGGVSSGVVPGVASQVSTTMQLAGQLAGGSDGDGYPRVKGLEQGVVSASSFRTFHTPLASQSDFTGAVRSALRLSESMSRDLGLDIYPYSGELLSGM